MKLALRSSVLVIVIALAAVFWWRSSPSGPNAAKPESASAAPVRPLASEASEPSATVLASEPEVTAREEVVSAQPQASSSSETLLRVLVVSKERSAPIASVHLTLRPDVVPPGFTTQNIGGTRGKAGESPATGADGRAEFVVEPGLAYVLNCFDEHYEHMSQSIEPLAANETREVTLAFATEDDLVVCCRVVDDASGAPLLDARVSVGRQSSYQGFGGGPPKRHELEKNASAVDTDGRIEFRAKSWLSGFAFAFADDYSLAVFSIERGHETPDHALELRLARTATVDALVRDDHGLVEGATVDLSTQAYRLQQGQRSANLYLAGDSHWSATTDASGRASIAELPPRVPLTVAVNTPGGKSRQESQPLRLEPGERRALEFVLGSGAVVSGRLEDGDGRAIAQWMVWRVAAKGSSTRWFRAHDDHAAEATTGDDGRFRFDDVPIGAWNIGPAPMETKPRIGPAGFAGLAQVVEIHDGNEQLDITLRVDRDLFLRGAVVDPSGAAPTTRCSVIAFVSGALAYANGASDEQGRFELGPLPAGTWTVFASGMGTARSEELQARAGTDGIVLKLRAGGTLQGTVVDGQTRTLTTCELALVPLDQEFGGTMTGSRDGNFKFAGLPAGRYVVNAKTTDGRHAHRRVEVRAGETLGDVELALEPGAKLVLRYTGNEIPCGYHVFANGDCVAFDGIEAGGSGTCVVPAGALEVRWKIYSTKVEATQTLTLAVGEQGELTWNGQP